MRPIRTVPAFVLAAANCISACAALMPVSSSAAAYSIHFTKARGDFPANASLSLFQFNFNHDGSSVFAAGPAHAFYQSNDGGVKWNKFNYSEDYNWKWIIYTDDNNASMLADVDSDFGEELIHSNDNGLSWTPIYTSCPKSAVPAVAIHNSKYNMLFTGKQSRKFYFSDDNGYNCYKTDTLSGSVSQSSDGRMLYSYSNSSLAVSNDYGDTWPVTYALSIGQMDKILVNPDNARQVFIETYDDSSGKSAIYQWNDGQYYLVAGNSARRIDSFIKLDNKPLLLTTQYSKPVRVSLAGPQSFPAESIPLDVYDDSGRNPHFFDAFYRIRFIPDPEASQGIFIGFSIAHNHTVYRYYHYRIEN